MLMLMCCSFLRHRHEGIQQVFQCVDRCYMLLLMQKQQLSNTEASRYTRPHLYADAHVPQVVPALMPVCSYFLEVRPRPTTAALQQQMYVLQAPASRIRSWQHTAWAFACTAMLTVVEDGQQKFISNSCNARTLLHTALHAYALLVCAVCWCARAACASLLVRRSSCAAACCCRVCAATWRAPTST
jgi:hypothetical protein